MNNIARKVLTVAALLCGITTATTAQVENKLEVKPSGRILMDAASFHSNNSFFAHGVAIPDARVGVKANYGKFKAKVDVGYAYGKVSLKDIFIERSISKSTLIRLGNFVHQFGLQSSTSSSMKPTMEEPTSNAAFFNSRLIGAMVVYDKDDFFGTASLHAESASLTKLTNEMKSTGYGAMSRLVYRPLRNDGAIFHVGISAAFEKPRYNNDERLNHNSFVLGANFPTRVAKVKALNAVIDDANYLFKFTPEIALAKNNIGFESQYYYLFVNRDKGFNNYKASGAYATVRLLLLGGKYAYSHGDSGLATPKAGSLEAVASYNYTNMTDNKAKIYGGSLSDISFTLNYYINKYMIWRFRYSYTDSRNPQQAIYDNYLSAFQTRLQIKF